MSAETKPDEPVWCDECGFHVSAEYIEEQCCPMWDCPVTSRPAKPALVYQPLIETQK